MFRKYFLIGHIPIECHDVLVWARQFEGKNRHVAYERIDGIEISTVFLGLDHFGMEGLLRYSLRRWYLEAGWMVI